jgi:murein DD-endopeptidase MepM/ murein hydrolase activator NlpD
VKRLLLFAGCGFVASFLLVASAVWRSARGAGGSARPSATTTAIAHDERSGPLRVVNVPPVDADDLDRLRSRGLLLPVEGLKADELRDNFSEARGGHPHEALDILAPQGTRVLAVDDGRVAKLFNSVRGGLTVYQFDPTETFCYYYAHLHGYAPGLAEGTYLSRGSLVGYVGTTGNAPRDTPHLHFTVFKLGPEKRWWEGTPINPFPAWAFPD